MKLRNKKVLAGTLLRVFGKNGQGLTASGRIMRVEHTQNVHFYPPNRYYNIRLTHISGPLAGIELNFPSITANKAKLQNTCKCSAYPYPHRKGSGKCQNPQ